MRGAPEPAGITATLTGVSTTVTFDGYGVSLRYVNAFPVYPLLRALGERHVPLAALRRVDLTPPGSTRWGVLRLVLHSGVDPVLDVVGDEPADSLDPYRIPFDDSQHEAAYRLRDLLERAIARSVPAQVSGFLLPAPVLRRIHGGDGVAEFDGRIIRITWRFGVTKAKLACGPAQVIPLSLVEEVEWLSPTSSALFGYLRIKVAGTTEMSTDPRNDPHTVLLDAFDEADSILFTAAVRAALATPPGAITVRREAGAAGDRDLTGIAEQGGEQVGLIHAHRCGSAPQQWEIDQLVMSAKGPDTDVCDALIAAVLRWASQSGGIAVTWWVSDWTEQRDAYERQGFHFVGKWRPAGTTGHREEWQIRVVLRPDAQFWKDDLLDVLDDVAPQRPRWRYLLRAAGILLLGWLGGMLAVGFGLELSFEQWLWLPGASWDYILTSTIFAACGVAFMRAWWFVMGQITATSAAKMLLKYVRPPVLYLRSFQDDSMTRKTSWIGSLTTEEQAVMSVVIDIGPFIGVGRSDMKYGPSPARVDNWQPAVTWLLARAQLVVLRCGTGEWLFWELEQAVKIIRPEQLLILVPADEETYRKFRDRAAGILPNPLPQLVVRSRVWNQLAAAIYFSAGWHPHVISLWQPLLLRLVLALDTRLMLRLRPILRQFRGTLFPFRFWVRRLVFPGLMVIGIIAIFRMTSDIEGLSTLWPVR